MHYAVIQRDITDCVNGKEALRESEERFRAVTEMVGEWLWEQDAEGRYTWTSATVTKVLGLEPGQILGKHYLDFLIPKACESLPGTVAVNRDNKNSFRNVVNRYMHREGYEVYLRLACSR